MAIVGQNVNPTYDNVSRFGVPISGVGGQGILMPKLKHRFRIEVIGFGGGATRTTSLTYFTQQVVTAGRPQVQFNNTELHSFNNITYIAQKPQWQTIDITLRDDISNGITSLVSEQVQSQMNFYTQSAAAAGVNYKFSMRMQTLDGTIVGNSANVLEDWYLEGCYLETVQYDGMDYSSSEPVMLTLTVRYDNATQGTSTHSPTPTTANNSSGNSPTTANTPV